MSRSVRPVVYLLAVLALLPVRAGAATLASAIKAGDRAAVRQLLEQKVDVNAPEADGTTPLHWAAYAGDAEILKALLVAGAQSRTANRYGVTPLHLAAVNGDAAIVTLLLDAGADANAVLPEGETILMTAARTGRTDALQALLDRGARVEARDKLYGETALIWAAAENHGAAVRLLVQRGADVNGRSTALKVARRRTGQSVLPLGDWTPMMYAARENAIEAGRALASAGANLNLTDPDGATALVIAIINAHYDFAALLLEAGADPNVVDRDAGMGPLYAAVDMHRLAVGHGRPNPRVDSVVDAPGIVRLLLEKQADPNARLKATIIQRHHTQGDSALGTGATPFMRAAKSGDVEMMKLLIAGGADPKATMPNKTNALMFAAGLGWRDGSPAAPSYDQGTPDDAVEAIRLLVASGLDINATNDAGDTPLHAAIGGRASEPIVRALIENGANLSAPNKRGQTPLAAATASRKDLSAIVALLRKASAP